MVDRMTSVGSVTVEVVPDARGWSAKLDAQIGNKTVHVDAELDTAEAEAKLAALRAESDRVGKSGENASRGFNKLFTAAALLGPAIVPIGAAALAAGVGLAGMGAAGLLAFEGIKHEMQDGTILGKQYSSVIDVLKSDLVTLEHTAAANVFGGFASGVADLHRLTPLVNSDVAILSSQLGTIVGNVLPGGVALLHQLNPLLVDLGGTLVDGSAGFKTWATSSQGVRDFVAYAQGELPKLEHTLGSVAGAAAHLGQAAAPIGGALVQALDAASVAIEHIPVPVLTAAIVALDVNRILKITNSLTGLTGALGRVGIGAATLNPVIAGLAIVGTAWAVSTAQQAEQQAKLAAATNEVTTALQASQGLFDANVRTQLARTAADTGATAALDKLGLSQTQYFDALAGGKQAQDDEARLILQTAQAKGLSKSATIQLLGPLGLQIEATQKAVDKWNLEKVATDAATGGVQALTAEQQKNIAATLGEESSLKSLNAALDALSNAGADAAQIELRFKDSLAGATDQVKQHGTSLRADTANGRSNQEWLISQIQTVNQHASAVGKQTGSTIAATNALAGDEAQLRQTAYAAGFNKSQVDGLIASYEATPDQVSTKINADARQALIAAGAFKNILGQIPRYVVTDIYTQIHNIYTAQDAAGNRGAAGVTSAYGNILDSVPELHYAWGGENHIPQIAYGTRVWAEPETGGEAYIPLAKDSRRERAVSLTADVASRFGFDLMPKSSDAPTITNNFAIDGRQWDEPALATAVARRLAMTKV
jgi:hypothetical protein